MEFTKFLSERFEPYKLEIRGKFKERYLITFLWDIIIQRYTPSGLSKTSLGEIST